MIEEIWKDIKGYEGLYQISNLGRVKSLERRVPFGDSYRSYPEKIKSQEIIKGYKRVNLYKKGKLKKFLVHRLVASSFINEQDGSMQVNHINGVTTDNRLDNLEWTTIKENANHKTTVLMKKPRGVYRTSENKWNAQIVFNQKNIALGTFANKSDAYKAFYDKYSELRKVPPWDINIYKTH